MSELRSFRSSSSSLHLLSSSAELVSDGIKIPFPIFSSFKSPLILFLSKKRSSKSPSISGSHFQFNFITNIDRIPNSAVYSNRNNSKPPSETTNPKPKPKPIELCKSPCRNPPFYPDPTMSNTPPES